jgi:hypothetical protein
VITGFTVPNPAATLPSGIYYRVTVKDSSNGQEVLRYIGVTFSGGTFNFDNYAPVLTGGTLAPLSGNSVSGNLSVTGNAAITGTVTASNIPGGTVNTGTGTTNKISKWTNGSTGVHGDSSITDDGTTISTAEPLKLTEIAAPSGAASNDVLYADSTAHRLKMNNNNGGAVQIVASGVDVNTSDQVTAAHISGLTTNTIAKGNATGNLVNSSVTDDGTTLASTDIMSIAPAGGAGTAKRLVVDNSIYLGVFSRIRPIQPYPTDATQATGFPAGADLSLDPTGPADLHHHNVPVDVTSSTSLTIGANASVVTSSNLLLSHATGVIIVIEPGGTQEEAVANASWSLVDATHLSITAAKTHTQPFTIRQMGTQSFDTGSITFSGDGKHAYIGLVDGQQNYIAHAPINTGASFPDNSWRWVAPITCAGNATVFAAADCIWRNASAAKAFKILDSAGATQYTFADTLSTFSQNALFTGTIFARNATSIWNDTGILALHGTSISFLDKLSKYNNIATAGQGVAPIYQATSQKAESAADTNVLTLTPAAIAGTYRVRFTLSLSAANAATLGWTATWKDSNGNAQSPTNLALSQTGVAAPALTFTTSSAGNYYGDLTIDVDNSATNIVIKLTFSGTSFAGKASATIEETN